MFESIEKESVLTADQKIFIIDNFLAVHPLAEIQDVYKWLYYGEFGHEEQVGIFAKEKRLPELQLILDDLKSEIIEENIPEKVWDPVGFSMRFVMVYLTEYNRRECPLKRLVNLIERSPAFKGSRMQFKLDWGLIKDHLTQPGKNFERQDFYNFEDKIGFYQLPEVSFTLPFLENYPVKYRIVPRKLFFDYFPEFDDLRDIKFIKKSYFE
ncbi:MAG: hypothetical protein K8R21_08475 [Leptospira sp.]|nr:hypothetical protein [Leptospira sp.]